MLYIITALSAEARPFIDHFRLKRVEDALPYPLFAAENVRLPVTRAGYEKLLASDIADIVEDILQMRSGSAVTEEIIHAQKFGITKKKK